MSQLPTLNLPHALFHIKVTPNRQIPSEHGTDNIDFYSQEILASRFLSLQIAPLEETCQDRFTFNSKHPAQYRKTLIFDEADVGVSGKTANMIGKLMRLIARQHQIICLTHSPQVAACGLQHWHIVKEHRKDQTLTQLHSLSPKDHIREVARLLSGMDVTEESLASARKLCENQYNPALSLYCIALTQSEFVICWLILIMLTPASLLPLVTIYEKNDFFTSLQVLSSCNILLSRAVSVTNRISPGSNMEQLSSGIALGT